jgi:hypothetical protein
MIIYRSPLAAAAWCGRFLEAGRVEVRYPEVEVGVTYCGFMVWTLSLLQVAPAAGLG